MKVRVDPNIHCKGYETVGTIVIDYNMYAGERYSKKFAGTRRVAYLPDN